MRTITRFFLLLLLLDLAGCMHQPVMEKKQISPPADQQNEAHASLQQGNYNDALKRYSDLLKKTPGNRDLLLGLGESYLGLDQSQQALLTFKQVLSTSPTDLDAMEGSGLAYMGLDQRGNAEEVLLRVVERDQQSWRAMNALGLINDLNGQYQKSMAWYEKALNAMDTESIIYNNYGYSRIMAHDFAQAEVLLNYGLKLDPNNIRIRNNLIMAIAWQGQYERALTVRGAIPLQSALNNIGYIAMLRKDLPTATGYFQRALDVSPTWYAVASANLDNARLASQAIPR